ncbi:Putative palmitoyltransferase ZDHHC22 [Atta colombica]|uniref:Palmitoyltransferase n=1 Tax=Atta colombica TaxID=520822 RepID=A0A195B3H6_9HYME|nr:PREDICTED: palmitoyltransferase ZDHHC22-like [Atta colombica]KYM79041.1 Putative palmitoyltransferase ZDHHC22 [Atta colombica]
MPRSQYIKTCLKIVKQLCPLVTLMSTVFVIAITIYINEKVSPVFVFLCMQVYLNWYSVYNISCKSNPMKVKEIQNNLCSVITQQRKVEQINSTQLPTHNTTYKFWHCEKCQSYMCKPTQHCVFCKKCFHFKDHHCFFLGACILRQNMGNFILFCFYTSLTCLYSLCVLGPYMYENINHIVKSDADYFNIFLNFGFPIALARLLRSRDSSSIFLVTIFDTLMSILCICLVFGIWKLHNCLTGKQRYVNVTRRQNLKEIFGSYGLSNIIFPYNGLVGTRDINGKYELKEV